MRVFGAKQLRQMDGFVDYYRNRRLALLHQVFINGEAQDITVDDRHLIDGPFGGVFLQNSIYRGPIRRYTLDEAADNLPNGVGFRAF